MARSARLGSALTLSVLVLAGAAHPSRTAGGTLRVGGSVKSISADGHRIAADVVTESKSKTCHRILIWSGSGKTTAVNAGCVDKFSHDQNVTALAFAGTRVLWVDYQYGNHAYCSLETATVAAPRPVDVDVCDPFEADTFVSGLAGDGPLLVFNSWYDENQMGTFTDVTLWRLVGSKAQKLLSGKSSRTATSVSAGRIAIREPAGTVAVYNADGTLARRFPAARTPRLDGSTLVVRKGNALQPYDVSTGTAGKARAMRGGKLARFEDVQGGIAVYVVKTAVHLLRLSDGRDVPIKAASNGKVHAQIEAPGLFYSSPSGLTFLPMSAVRARLG